MSAISFLNLLWRNEMCKDSFFMYKLYIYEENILNAVTMKQIWNIGGGGKAVHVVLKYLSRSLL